VSERDVHETSDYFELVQPTFSTTSSSSSTTTINSNNIYIHHVNEQQQQQQQPQLQLVVKRALDRETIPQHNLTVMACDGGQPSNCGQLRISLNLADINDNNPIFRRELYEFAVEENAPAGTVLGKLEAFDLDAGDNQRVRYKLMSPSRNFELDELTGVLKLARPVDFENDQQFSLKVKKNS
jgi:hypothetical protein